MRKILLLMTVFFAINSYAQLPYSKMIDLEPKQLLENNFKYNKEKNQYVLKKSNGLNKTANILNAVNGTTADIKPHKDDYIIVRQEGASAVSSLSVTFYSDDTFHDIETWLLDNDIEFIETNSGKLLIQKFNYENYYIELSVEKVGVTASTAKGTSALAKTFDESYNIYNYIIYTGVDPQSKWHEKQQSKKDKRDEKGKKKDLNDLM